jgi:2-polyprenyl-3-methyl-5-hydroxy-6-metoxy-1,4-benzoquinol methylase
VKLLSTGLSQQVLKVSEALGGFLVEHHRLPRTNRGRRKFPLGSSDAGRIFSLRDLAVAKEHELWKTKLAHRTRSFWYPYATLGNIPVLERLLTSVGLNLLELCRGNQGRVADFGGADGDLAFFLEQLGFSVDVIDYEQTNFNKLDGARILKKALDSSVTIYSVDLDSRFAVFGEKYDAVFLLGVLYHLKNPFYTLERLAHMTRHCFLSTRIARQTADGLPLSKYPVAYLLGPEECNSDNTNFWIFSDEGLKRLIRRAGWSILAYTTIGDTNNSTPADPNHDERVFCVLQSNAVINLSAFPNPVPADERIGRTTIRWNTANSSPGKVYVSVNGQEESLFASGCQGAAAANWIQPGANYEFRLYDSDHIRLLDKVVVTTVENGSRNRNSR